MVNSNETKDRSRWNQLNQNISQFYLKYAKPDCEIEYFVPFFLLQGKKNILHVHRPHYGFNVTYFDIFSLSNYLIFLLTIMEIFLNITFNQSTFIVLNYIENNILR